MGSINLGSDQRGYFWVNYNELTTSSLEIMVSKGNHPQMALIQVSELLQFAQIFSENRIFALKAMILNVSLPLTNMNKPIHHIWLYVISH